jgi:branched-chain amino acid transport system permease protein
VHGFNIVVGFAGLLDLGYIAFYAVGTSMRAACPPHFDLHLPFWIILPSARRRMPLRRCWAPRP